MVNASTPFSVAVNTSDITRGNINCNAGQCQYVCCAPWNACCPAGYYCCINQMSCCPTGSTCTGRGTCALLGEPKEKIIESD